MVFAIATWELKNRSLNIPWKSKMEMKQNWGSDKWKE